MSQRPGRALADRAGPHTRPAPAATAEDPTANPTPPPDPSAGRGPDGVGPPPGTGCWIHPEHPTTAGIVLGWQQHDDGHWYALVSAWLPRTALTPRP